MAGRILFFLLLWLSAPSTLLATARECGTVVEVPRSMTDANIVDLANGLRRSGNTGLGKANQTSTQKWISANLADLRYSESPDNVFAWVDQKLSSYAKNLNQEREDSLTASLRRHGVSDASDLTGYHLLREVSRNNLERIFSHEDISKASAVREADQEIRDLVDSVRLTIRHNTNVFQSHGNLLLSSRRLYEAGLGGGLNSKSAFNRVVLESDDNVFFFARFQFQTVSNKDSSELKYGKNAFILKESVAEQVAWISHFSMYASDVMRFLELHPVNDNYELSQQIAAMVSGGVQGFSSPANTLIWKKIVQRMFILDFTYQDYKTLSQTALTLHLMDLKNRSPELFSQAVAKIVPGPRQDLDGFMRNVLETYGVGTMEAKVPVGVKWSEFENP